jgi:tRNA ligase
MSAAQMSFEKKYPAAVSELLAALRALRINNPKATRSSVHIYPASIYAPNDPDAKDRRIISWKMTEHLYFKKDNGFPTLARGLFTEQVTSLDQVPPASLATCAVDGKVDERIVARGYDKFFNTDEMAWTSVCSKPFYAMLTLYRSGRLSKRTRSRPTT